MTTRAEHAAERTTATLLLEWDQTRPRSQQRALGWSEVGGCRRRAGYRLAGVEPSNPGGSVQAVLGTAIHDAVQQRLNETAGPDDLIEYEVVFAGIPGHLDRYEAATGDLVDVKTTSSRWLEHIKIHGPDRSHLWQLNGYAAALRRDGRRVHRLVLDYIARDTGELYRWTGRPSNAVVAEALGWLQGVRSVPVEMLNRDYAPDGPFCQHCPFYETCWDGAVPDRDPRSVLLVEDGDARRWARQLLDARADKAAAADRESEARGALDALRQRDADQPGRDEPLDLGDDLPLLQWQVVESHPVDTTAVKAEYRTAGAEPPTRMQLAVKLAVVPRPDGPP